MSAKTPAGAEGDTRRLDADGDDPSSFKNYVLYILNDNAGSDKLLNLVRAKPGLADKTWVQDVKLLRERPPWLNGVPIIVDKGDKKAYRGSSAFTFVQQFVDTEMAFGGFGSSSSFAFDDGKDRGPRSARLLGAETYGLVNPSAADPDDTAQAAGMRAASGQDMLMPPTSDDAAAAASGRKKRKGEDATAATEAYMNARREIDLRVQQSTGGGGMQQRVAF